ncbi:MAG: prephenate dehydratase [Calditrichia bacterium]
MNVAIQGGRASFHDMAARKYFAGETLELLECASFRELCRAVVKDRVDFALMAIENTLVGSILPNYSLLREYPLSIQGEVYLPISHHLMALPGQRFTEIKSVRSHPMALLQCSEFLDRYPQIHIVEGSDTADSARDIRENSLSGVAAIASRLAAETYELDVLADHIENLQHNYTRFLILSASNIQNSHGNKAALNFRVDHSTGSLVKALGVMSAHEINLTQIQSIALPDHPHEYAFHVDVEWDTAADFEKAMQEMQKYTRRLTILGRYSKGERPYDRTTSQPT